MNIFKTLLLCGAPLAAAAFTVAAEAHDHPKPEQRRVTVSAEGEALIPATHALVQLSVQTRAERPAEAQQNLSERANRVLEFLRAEAEIERLQTAALSLRPIFERGDRPYPGPRNGPEIVAYEASTSVSFRVPAESAGQLIDQAVERGATQVASFRLTALDEVLRAARKDALQDATRQALGKADAVLQELGYERREIARIQIQGEPVYPMERMSMAAAADAGGSEGPTPVAPGLTRISAMVTLEVAY